MMACEYITETCPLWPVSLLQWSDSWMATESMAPAVCITLWAVQPHSEMPLNRSSHSMLFSGTKTVTVRMTYLLPSRKDWGTITKSLFNKLRRKERKPPGRILMIWISFKIIDSSINWDFDEQIWNHIRRGNFFPVYVCADKRSIL